MNVGFGVGKNTWQTVSGAAVAQPEFIIEVKTDNVGTSNNDQFTLPYQGATTYDVDWGDGNTDLTQSGTTTHTYSIAGTYEIKVTGGGGIRFNFGGDKDKLLDIKNWGDTVYTTTVSDGAFAGCDGLTSITALDTPDLSSATSLNSWFYLATNLASINNISNWDVSTITNFSSMFRNATLFNSSLGNWDTSAGLNMSTMFYLAAAFDQDIGHFSMNQATSIGTFFLRSAQLSTANYDALLIGWDTQTTWLSSGGINFGTSTYTSGGAAEAARTSLITKVGTITDGGAA